MSNKTQISPLNRNGINSYLQRYLNTVSDWQTYRDASDEESFQDKAKAVTQSYFGHRKLKGLSFLLTAHVVQQVSASLVSILIRTWLSGAVRNAHRGIVIRESQVAQKWTDQMPIWLTKRATMTDSYYFHEGGRTWHCHSFEIIISAQVTKTLTVLTLLSLPNRVYYFDRPVSETDAVDLALSVKDADSLPGFIGDLRELDTLLPFIRLLKMALYGLNWYLVDEDERDQRGPSILGYNDLGYPSGPSWGGSTAYPFNRPTSNNPSSYPTNSGYGYPPTAPSSYGSPSNRSTSLTLWSGNQPPTNHPEVTLIPSPIRLQLGIQRANGQQEPMWHTVDENAYLVYNGNNRAIGLGVAPMLEARADGVVRELNHQWSVVHLETGHLLNQQPLETVYQARELTARLASIDWSKPFDQVPREDLNRAQQIMTDYLNRLSQANGHVR